MSQTPASETSRKSQEFDAHTAAWVLQLAESLMQATEVFGNQTVARDWLVTPHRQLSGAAPIDQLAQPRGPERVSGLLEDEHSRIKSRDSRLGR